MTNSAKYGALSDAARPGGRRLGARRLGRASSIHWRESGGPPVKPPRRRGFGTTLIERSIPYELKGEAEIAYELTGLRGRFAVPARYVARRPDRRPPRCHGSATATRRARCGGVVRAPSWWSRTT